MEENPVDAFHIRPTLNSNEAFIYASNSGIVEVSGADLAAAVEDCDEPSSDVAYSGDSPNLILPDAVESAKMAVSGGPLHQNTDSDVNAEYFLAATRATTEDKGYNQKVEKRQTDSKIDQNFLEEAPTIKYEAAETNHDLDALAEIVPGLFSALQITTRINGETSEQVADEELWRVGAAQSVEAYSENKLWAGKSNDLNAPNQPPFKRYDDDSDSKEGSLEIPNNVQAEVEAATYDENQEKDESSSASSSTTFSGHAKPSKSKRDFVEDLSLESGSSQEEEEEEENKKSSPKVESPPSSAQLGHTEPPDSKPTAESYQKKRELTSKSSSRKKTEDKHDGHWDKTPPKPPQPQAMLPMYLPYFKPATGCTNASDFIVRCFVARLRSGISVIKHGRSRWCKSVTRILHIHPDGRSLSWKPPLGEPTSSKKPPKLDLLECKEVRHAWSPDPLHPLYTGTVILRQKCEAANAHKSFALIFPKRTVDVTAITADQCKVLMEGFSALCFRLQVANLAGQMPRFSESMENVYDRNVERKAGGSDVALSRSSGGL